jgi:hypothetical protein
MAVELESATVAVYVAQCPPTHALPPHPQIRPRGRQIRARELPRAATGDLSRSMQPDTSMAPPCTASEIRAWGTWIHPDRCRQRHPPGASVPATAP